jgi:hypothetical protein
VLYRRAQDYRFTVHLHIANALCTASLKGIFKFVDTDTTEGSGAAGIAEELGLYLKRSDAPCEAA